MDGTGDRMVFHDLDSRRRNQQRRMPTDKEIKDKLN
jgi:hypothetical protein